MFSKIINSLEQKSKISIRTHIPSTAWLFVGQFISAIGSLALTVLMANLLTEEAFGTYKYLLTIFGFISILSLTGLITSATRAVAQGYEGEVVASTITALKYSGGMIVLGGGISAYYLLQGNLVLGLGSLVATLAAPLVNALPLYAAIVNGRHDHKVYSILGILINVVPVICTLGVLYITQNILFLFATFILSQVALHAALYVYVRYTYAPNTRRDHKATSYGKHLSLMNILGGISYQLDKLLVWHFLGPVQLAVYTIALAPAQQLRYLNKIITTITLPRFSKHSILNLQQTMLPKMLTLLVFSIFIVIGYILIAPFLFQYFVPTYTNAIIYSQVFALIILFFPAGLLQEALKAQAEQKALYVIQTVIPGMKIILLSILTPLLGIYGVLLSMFICEAVRLLIALWYFYKPRIAI
jgi:O-antigen/teichoic acid export membrane protein